MLKRILFFVFKFCGFICSCVHAVFKYKYTSHRENDIHQLGNLFNFEMLKLHDCTFNSFRFNNSIFTTEDD